MSTPKPLLIFENLERTQEVARIQSPVAPPSLLVLPTRAVRLERDRCTTGTSLGVIWTMSTTEGEGSSRREESSRPQVVADPAGEDQVQQAPPPSSSGNDGDGDGTSTSGHTPVTSNVKELVDIDESAKTGIGDPEKHGGDHQSSSSSPSSILPKATDSTTDDYSSTTGTGDSHQTSISSRQVIAVSASKGPAAFFNLARKFLITDEVVDLSALEGAIVSAVDAAHLLERSKLASIVR